METTISNGPTGVAIVTPKALAYSETFIRAHIERLPGLACVLTADTLTRINDLRQLGLDAFPWRVFRAAIPRRFWQVDKWLLEKAERRFLASKNVRCALAEYGPVGAAWLEVFERAGIPLVVHFHGYDAYVEDVIRERCAAYERMFQRCAAIVAVSHDMEEQLVSLGAPRHKVHYNPYGVDCTLFAPTNPAANPPLFLAVGRFVEKKAPHLTILAFRRTLQACPNARLRMIGDGPLWKTCSDLVRQLDLQSAVELPGKLPHEQVAAAMKEARAFLQHSVRAPNGDSEGTPVAILEAGASGLPVVATRHAGIKDVVIEGRTGFLVDEGNVEGMAEHMLLLAQEPALAAQMGAAARALISAQFTIERSIAGLANILQQATQRIEDQEAMT